MINLSFNQMCVLSAISNKDCYGLQIIEEVKKESNIVIVLGSLYNILHKLEKEGLVKSYFGKETAERGGNRRKYYSITAIGEKTLNEAQFKLAKLWGWDSFIKKIIPKFEIRNFLLSIILTISFSFPLLGQNTFSVIFESNSSILLIPLGIYFSVIIFEIAFLLCPYLTFKVLGEEHEFEKLRNCPLPSDFLHFFYKKIFRINFPSLRSLLFPIKYTGTLVIAQKVESKEDIENLNLLYSTEKYEYEIIIDKPTKEKILVVYEKDGIASSSYKNILNNFSYFIPSGKREEIIGDLFELNSQMKRDGKSNLFRKLVLLYHMIIIIIAMRKVQLLDFVSGSKKKEKSK